MQSDFRALQLFKADLASEIQFLRGEIEDEKFISGLIHMVQMSAVSIRSNALSKQWQKVTLELSPWSQYSANLVCDESSLVGLRVASLIRSLLMDEVDTIRAQYKNNSEKDKYLKTWLLGLRMPWPVDRVVLFESKRFLKNKSMKAAEKLAARIQINPYKSASEILKQEKQNIPDKDYDFLTKLWSEKDIELMKEEMNRLGLLLLKIASEEFHSQ